jgi:type IV pilus assembly protein PilY1
MASRLRIAVLLALGCATGASADIVSFAKGSLIVPLQSSFQTPCGALSAYGLVYRILEANSAGGYFDPLTHPGRTPVTIYWVVSGTKQSPNRCIPTNLNTALDSSTVTSVGSAYNDGCDFSITNTLTQPVVPVDFSTDPWSGLGTGMFPTVAVPMRTPTVIGNDNTRVAGGVNYDGFQTPEAIPAYPAQTLSGPTFTTIQYMGGPFVIAASDAQNVIEFLENGDPASATFPTTVGIQGGNPGAPSVKILDEFTGANSSYATLSSRPGGYFDQCTGPRLLINGRRQDGTAAGTDHYVTMHQATTSFTANVARRINTVPPKIALIDTTSNGDSTGTASVGTLKILDSYLGNAGVYFAFTTNNTDSGGCPNGTLSGCATNGGKPGFIYDQFDADQDIMTMGAFADGVLGQTDITGKLIYGVLWTPHWEAHHDPAGNGVGGLKNIATYLDNRGTGLMGECASIGSYERASNNSGPMPGLGTPNTNFLFSGPIVVNNLSAHDGKWEGNNCTDPDYTTGANTNLNDACTVIGGLPCGSAGHAGECVYWDNTTSEFSQIGDYHFVQVSGTTDDFKPDNTLGTTYKPSTLVLATTWKNYQAGQYPGGGSGCNVTATDKSCDNHWDIMDLGQKDGDPNKATIVYVAGHDYQISTVGSRIILNTLLNLGQQPLSQERALAAPTVYADPNGACDSTGGCVVGSLLTPTPLVFSPVYDVLSGVSSSAYTYGWANGSQWIFPRIPGNVYEHPLVNVGSIAAFGATTISFNSNSLFDAQGQISKKYGGAAGNRNLFTFVGGKFAFGPAGGRQQGLTAIPIDTAQIDGPPPNCVDQLQLGQVIDAKHPAGYWGFKPGADGQCDLEEIIEFNALNGGADFGASEAAANTAVLNLTSTHDSADGMIEVVQGYCFSTTGGTDGTGHTHLPTGLGDCNNQINPTNAPTIGGMVHSQPAVVNASPVIPDLGAARPTVLYAAGADGQLHAYYVSGGTGYQGPQATLAYPAGSDATAAFSSLWAVPFAPPNPMTELWSFMPASQIQLLAGNQQMVDSAPVVMDVFADFSGNLVPGLPQWHTVLVATAGNPLGNPGAEVFALDITNPLVPHLLWDLVGSWAGQPPGTVSPIALADDSIDSLSATKWIQTGIGGVYPPAGSSLTGVFDYSDLGASYGLSLGIVRTGNTPLFRVFVSSNLTQDPGATPMNNGAQVYAIDVATGQKVWQWQEPYQPIPAATSPGDPVPQPVTLLTDTRGSTQFVYAGDLEGRLWELSALTGESTEDGKGVGGSGAIFATPGGTLEPLTTSLLIAKLPTTLGIGGLVPGSTFAPPVGWQGDLIGLVGTAGSPDGFVPAPGGVHVVNLMQAPTIRPLATGVAPADPAAPFTPPNGAVPIPGLPAMRVYGASMSGTLAIFTTNSKGFNDPLAVDITASGGAYTIDLGTSAGGPLSNLGANYTKPMGGAVQFFYDATTGMHIIGSQVNQMTQVILPPASSAAPNAALKVNGPVGGLLYQVLGWVRRTLL